MNAEGFAQVPDLDEQLNDPSTAVTALRQHASSFDDDMYAHQFNKQTPYLGQDGSLPQHFMQGGSDMDAGQSFPLGRSAPSVNMFTTVNAPVSSSGTHQVDKPTPAQAAAGRLQRASAQERRGRVRCVSTFFERLFVSYSRTLLGSFIGYCSFIGPTSTV